MKKPIKHIFKLEGDASPEDVAHITSELKKRFPANTFLVIAGPITYYPVHRKAKTKLSTIRKPK